MNENSRKSDIKVKRTPAFTHMHPSAVIEPHFETDGRSYSWHLSTMGSFFISSLVCRRGAIIFSKNNKTKNLAFYA